MYLKIKIYFSMFFGNKVFFLGGRGWGGEDIWKLYIFNFM